MGFRNPATTAAGLDTGADLGHPGVRIYQDTANSRGVVEFRDGHAGLNPAAVSLTDDAPDGSLRHLIVDGGAGGKPGGGPLGNTWPPVASGSLTLGTYNNAARAAENGGYEGRAYLTADSIYLTGQTRVGVPITSPDAAWQALPLLSGWTAWDTSKNIPRTWRDASGTVHVRGIVKIAAGASLGAGANGIPCTALPFPTPAQDCHGVAVLLTPSGTYYGAGWHFATGSTLTIPNNAGAALGAGYGWALDLAYPST